MAQALNNGFVLAILITILLVVVIGQKSTHFNIEE